MTISCSKLLSGRVVFGNLIETGITEIGCAGKVIEVDGKKYRLVAE